MKSPDQQTLFEARKAYTLTPGRVLDTAVSITADAADAQLTHTAAVRAAEMVDDAYPEWNRLYQSPELTSQEKRVVKRHMGEISLVASAAEQVLMDQDNSEEIASLEQELYGYYSPELFSQAVAAKIKIVEAFEIPEQYETYRQVVLEKLSQFAPKAEAAEKIAPSEQTLHEVSNWLHDQFGDIMQEIDDDKREEFDAPAIAEYFQKAIDSTPALRDNGWTVELVERQKSAISTSFYQKKFVIPIQRKVKKGALKTLAVHEVFGHGLRSAQAEQHGMEVGQHGTATYTRFEESFMIALEQCLKGEYDPKRGVDHYVATGLSITGGMPKEEIANLMGGMSFLGLLEKHTPEQAKVESAKREVAILNRTFTGMTDVDDGIAHRKDIDYYHGLTDAWKLLNHAVKHNVLDQTMRWVLSAKFNPFDAEDRAYVNDFAPMPRELEALFDEGFDVVRAA